MRPIWCYLLVLLIIFMVAVQRANLCPPWFLRIQQQVTNEAMSLVYYNVYVSPLGVGEEEGDREEEEEEREEEGTGRRRRKKKGRKRGIEKGGRSAIVNVRDEPYLQGI